MTTENNTIQLHFYLKNKKFACRFNYASPNLVDEGETPAQGMEPRGELNGLYLNMEL